MVERNAQDQRIEEAVTGLLLAWEARAAAAAQVEEAERETAKALVLLSREKVPVHDMAAMTGIYEAVCIRLLKSQAAAAREPVTGGRGDGGAARCRTAGTAGRRATGPAGGAEVPGKDGDGHRPARQRAPHYLRDRHPGRDLHDESPERAPPRGSGTSRTPR